MAQRDDIIRVKLLSDQRTRRVLFAEAGKDFVDFLFSLLTLPVGTVIKLLTKQSMVGCIAKLYGSVVDLSDVYMQSNQNKTALLEPRVVEPSTCRNLLTLENATGRTPIYYTCDNQSLHPTLSSTPFSFSSTPFSFSSTSSFSLPQGFSSTRSSGASPNTCDFSTRNIHQAPSPRGFSNVNIPQDPQDPHHYITAVKGAKCPYCKVEMNAKTIVVIPATATSSEGDEKGGYVKDVVTYMITDDLVITPMSTISGLTLLNKFSIQDVRALEEKVVSVGMEEGLQLLRASLESKTALTDVFLGKQSPLMA